MSQRVADPITSFTTCMPTALMDRLRHIAAAEGKSVSAVIRERIVQGLPPSGPEAQR